MKEWQASHTFETGQKAFPRLLRSSVIYGANASGKSNLLRAMQFVQAFVLQSAALVPPQPAPAASGPEFPPRILVPPFLLDKTTRTRPSEFEVTFVTEGVRYQYGFVVDAERVYREWLLAYPHGRPQQWYLREFDAKRKDYTWEFGSKLKGDYQVWRKATRHNVLFLSMAIQLNSEQFKPVFNWFQQKLSVVTGTTQFNPGLTFNLLDEPKGKAELMKFLRAADLGIDDVELRTERIPPGFLQTPGVQIAGPGDGPGPQLRRMLVLHKASGLPDLVPLELPEESAGTVKLIALAGAMLKVLREGAVAFVDELDSSLHPHMVRFLINLFHSNKTNKHNAQLFFSTHDTSLLDGDLFRRDQIWFVEKDKAGASKLYSLLEFRPRKDEALGRGYLPFIGELRI
jgi:hypothetical protein